MKEQLMVPVRVLQEILDQLCQCNYTCEAGHIERNIHFQRLASFVNNTLALEPIWELAPEWAKYWAMDKEGDGYWYENHPTEGLTAWYHTGGDVEQNVGVGEEVENWKDTLRERDGAVLVSSTPDWSSAPEWARWWAEDEDGRHFWYPIKPVLHSEMWKVDGTEFELAGSESTGVDWRNSLTKRPAGSATATFTPSWEEAPAWAEWFAQDGNGDCYWYRSEPYAGHAVWLPESVRAGEVEKLLVELPENPDWRETLQERPK